jgi:hypothetical protein
MFVRSCLSIHFSIATSSRPQDHRRLFPLHLDTRARSNVQERKEPERARRNWNRNTVPDERVNRPSALFDLSIVSDSPPDL